MCRVCTSYNLLLPPNIVFAEQLPSPCNLSLLSSCILSYQFFMRVFPTWIHLISPLPHRHCHCLSHVYLSCEDQVSHSFHILNPSLFSSSLNNNIPQTQSCHFPNTSLSYSSFHIYDSVTCYILKLSLSYYSFHDHILVICNIPNSSL